MSPTPQTPPTDRPLTAGDYVLMKRGLFYRPNAAGYTGIRDNAGIYSADDAAQHADPLSGVTAIALADAPEIAPNCFADIARDHLLKKLNDLRATNARPSTSAASEVEGDVRDVLWKALQKYAMTNMGDGDGNGYPLIDLMSNDGTTVATGREEMLVLADHLSEALEKAALASSPVSERERELEGTLREAAIVAKNMADNAAYNLNQAGLTRETATCESAFVEIYKVLARAPAAQPTGEGK